MKLFERRKPGWMRKVALFTTCAFVWSMVLATPLQAWANMPKPKEVGVRHLSQQEMEKIVGSDGGLHPTSVSFASGGTFPWEASSGGTNVGNGNKSSTLPIVGWTARGGMPVSFTLYHNSESSHNGELGQKWTHSYDIYLAITSG